MWPIWWNMWTKFTFSDLSIIYSKNPDSHTWSVTDMVESIEAKIPILHSKNGVVAAATSDRNIWTKLIQKWSIGWSRHLLKQDYGHQLLGLHPNEQSDREITFPKWTKWAKEEQSQRVTGIAKDWDYSSVQFSSVMENFVGAHRKFSQI